MEEIFQSKKIFVNFKQSLNSAAQRYLDLKRNFVVILALYVETGIREKENSSEIFHWTVMERYPDILP